ncbi:hypothetical protein V1478_010839 [Vespula squamosa]|uniref:Uncharacterized protein n=1 Tax=Vespula squamosa TaxID=30214 RepID=A0ABD2AGG5_VESSQ
MLKEYMCMIGYRDSRFVVRYVYMYMYISTYLYWLDSIAIHIRSRTSGLHGLRGVGACLVGWLVGWVVGWLVGWLVGCLVGWLVACLLACLLGCLLAWCDAININAFFRFLSTIIRNGSGGKLLLVLMGELHVPFRLEWSLNFYNLLKVVPSSMMNDAGTKERLMGLCIIDSGSRTSMTVTRFTVCNGYANAISLVGMASNRLDR